MRLELAQEGIKAQIIIINDQRANKPGDREKLLLRTKLPLFQDTAYKSVWTLHASGKDDMLIYSGAAKLVQRIAAGNETVPSDLSSPEGYAAVKGALVKAAQTPPAP